MSLKAKQPHFYEDADGLWRWRLFALNGEQIGSSSESFASKQKARENYELVVDSDEGDSEQT